MNYNICEEVKKMNEIFKQMKKELDEENEKNAGQQARLGWA